MKGADLKCDCGAKPANLAPEYEIGPTEAVSWRCENGHTLISGAKPGKKGSVIEIQQLLREDRMGFRVVSGPPVSVNFYPCYRCHGLVVEGEFPCPHCGGTGAHSGPFLMAKRPWWKFWEREK